MFLAPLKNIPNHDIINKMPLTGRGAWVKGKMIGALL
jgi:hypothetical protein